MRVKIYLAAVVAVVLLGATMSCSTAIKQGMLYGRWDYVKVSNPYSDPPDSVSRTEIAEKQPYIELSQDGKLQIMWGGQLLSHGTYVTDGNNIRFTEQLAGGKTRTFPFWVKKLTDDELVFETTGADGSHVEAKKHR